jgi:hypothetical protein
MSIDTETKQKFDYIAGAAWIVRAYCEAMDAARRGKGKVRWPDAQAEHKACEAWLSLCCITAYFPRMPTSKVQFNDAMQHISFQESDIGAWLAWVTP